MFKPIKDWTDEELAIEHVRVKARIALETGDESYLESWMKERARG